MILHDIDLKLFLAALGILMLISVVTYVEGYIEGYSS